MQHAYKICPRLVEVAAALHILNAYIYRNGTYLRASYYSLAAAASTIATS